MNVNKILKKQEEERKNATKERDLRCVPVVKSILKLIAEADLPLGNDVSDGKGGYSKETTDKYDVVNKKVLEIMLEADINFTDKNYIFQLLAQPIAIIREDTEKALGLSFDLALKQAFEKDFIDVKMSDIDKMLRRNIVRS